MVSKICIDRLKKNPQKWLEGKSLKIPHYSPKKKNALHIIGLKSISLYALCLAAKRDTLNQSQD